LKRQFTFVEVMTNEHPICVVLAFSETGAVDGWSTRETSVQSHLIFTYPADDPDFRLTTITIIRCVVECAD